MILTTHALVGAAIGKNAGNPWIIIAASLVVHFILDGFRHGEYFDSRVATIRDTWWKVTIDILVALAIIFSYLLFFRPPLHTAFNILLGAFFSMFPDLTTVLFWKFHWGWLGKIKKIHEAAHHYTRFPKFSPERAWTLRNARNDILFSLIAIILLFL